MAKLKVTVNANEYDSLDDSLKSFYMPSGDNWILDAEGVEDVSGLKAKNAALIADLKKRTDIVKQFEGLDPDAARKALIAMEQLEEKKLLDKQKFDEVLAKREEEFKKREADLTLRYQRIFETSANTDLQVKLLAHGVRPEHADDLAIVLKAKYIKPTEENGATVWKSLANDAEIIDLDTFIPSLKENGKATYFLASDASGSGASGSSGNGTGHVKQMKEDVYDALTPQQQATFIKGGGQVV